MELIDSEKERFLIAFVRENGIRENSLWWLKHTILEKSFAFDQFCLNQKEKEERERERE